MSITKVKTQSPDPVLEKAPFSEHAFARIAHVNAALENLAKAVSTVGVLPASTDLAGTTVTGLRGEVETRLDAIESKLNAIINALS
ncbi:MAG: hypothetical protein RIR01_2374 [Bacteroidota bacterium]|jgi:hypothetical protein